MKIIGSGYLSEVGKDMAAELASTNQAGFEALLETIGSFRSFASSREVVSQESLADKQKVVSLLLAVRLLEVTEAAYVVMQQGMSTEADSLFRTFLDAYFVFGNVCSNENFVVEFFNSDEANRLKLINAARKHSTDLFKLANEGIPEEHRSDLKARVEGEKIQAFNSYKYATDIGCGHIYDSMYRIVSAAVHTTPRALLDYAEADAAGNLMTARDGPSEGSIPQRLHDFSHFLIEALSGLQEVFGCINEAEISGLSEMLMEVTKK